MAQVVLIKTQQAEYDDDGNISRIVAKVGDYLGVWPDDHVFSSSELVDFTIIKTPLSVKEVQDMVKPLTPDDYKTDQPKVVKANMDGKVIKSTLPTKYEHPKFAVNIKDISTLTAVKSVVGIKLTDFAASNITTKAK
jgi:hypothetical protein